MSERMESVGRLLQQSVTPPGSPMKKTGNSQSKPESWTKAEGSFLSSDESDTRPAWAESAECPACWDIGFVKDQNGKIVPCPRGCAYPYEQARVERITGLTFIPYPEADLVEWKNARTRPVRDVVLTAIGERKPLFALIVGRYGVGKTWLLSAAVLYARKAKRTALYATAADMLSAVRRGFDRGNAEDVLSVLESVDVLAVDEVNRINETAWSETTLFQVLDRRYLSGRVTLMASNARPTELPGYLTSRAQDVRRGGHIWEWWDMPDLRRLR